MTFGKWLKIKLKQNKIQQKTLAKEICVSENTITSWVSDSREPSIRNFKWIVKYIAMKEQVPEYDVYNEASSFF
jgi:transcriptional regulator with XRE-family HTH domain